MIDLSVTITIKSDQLNAEDLIASDKIIKITKVSINSDLTSTINFEGDNGRPYKPCLTMRKVLIHLWGKDGSNYVGRKLRLYNDKTVTLGKDVVGGIRISHLSHIKKKEVLLLALSRGKKKAFTFEPLVDDVMPQETYDQFEKKHLENYINAASESLESEKKYYFSIRSNVHIKEFTEKNKNIFIKARESMKSNMLDQNLNTESEEGFAP